MSLALQQFEHAVHRLKAVARGNGPQMPQAEFGGAFSADPLHLDAAVESGRIAKAIHEHTGRLRRRGAVIALSGSIETAVCAALSVSALSANRVLAVLMPDKESDTDAVRLGRLMADTLGVQHVVEDLTPMLTASGCYARRDESVRQLVPSFGAGWACRLVPARLGDDLLIVRAPDGRQQALRMPPDVQAGVAAAQNMKERIRRQVEYYHAERRGYAVVGSADRLAYEQGLFAKHATADIMPIAHLYRSQVQSLAEHLRVPEAIRQRMPAADTASLVPAQGQPFGALLDRQVDLCLFGYDHGAPPGVVARAARLTVAQVERAWDDIAAKRQNAAYLHEPPMLIEATR